MALHELGNALGLRHSPYKDSIMYLSVGYTKEKKGVQLSNEDILKAQLRYGVKGTAAPPPTPATTPNPCLDRAPGCDTMLWTITESIAKELVVIARYRFGMFRY